MRFCIVTSSPIVGSSRKSTCGRCRSEPTISTFIRSPSDSCRTGLRTRSPTLEQLDQLVAQRRRKSARGMLVDRAVELERVERREVPLQLVAVPHDERDPAQEVALALRRHVAEHAGLAAARRRGGPESILSVVVFPAPFGPRKPTISPGAIVERDAVDGAHLARLAPDEALRRRLQARRRARGRRRPSAGRRPVTAGSLIPTSSASRASSRTARRARRPTVRAGSRPRR